MPVDWKYMPVLKWKRGERTALQKMTVAQRERVVPLAELQRRDDGSLPLAQEIADHLKASLSVGGAIAIDTTQLSLPGEKPLDLLISLCSAIQKIAADRQVIPVIHGALLAGLAGMSTKLIEQLKAFPEIMLRLRTDQITSAQVVLSVDAIKTAGIKKSSIHLMLDQFSMVERDVAASEKTIRAYLNAAIAEKCLSVTLAGGSFPLNLMGKKKGITDLDRVEWLVWELVKAHPEYSALRYADYTVTNPTRLPEIDPTQVNPSIAIRYATPKFWRLFKGGGFKKGTPGTLSGLCKLLTLDPIYSGNTFSDSDKTYWDTAVSKTPKNGIPWTWRRDATNHHIVLTAAAL